MDKNSIYRFLSKVESMKKTIELRVNMRRNHQGNRMKEPVINMLNKVNLYSRHVYYKFIFSKRVIKSVNYNDYNRRKLSILIIFLIYALFLDR